MVLAEDIEPESHLIPRMIITQAMEMHEYEVIPGYYIWIKSTGGNPNRAVIPPDMKDEYYKEFDLRCKKVLDNGLVEEIYIEIGNEDDWDTRHSSANSSKYVYHKQMGNDAEAEQRLHMLVPDAILIRPSKGEIIALGDNLILVYNHIKNLSRKYVRDFVQEKTTTKF
jgi:hypothetical protein